MKFIPGIKILCNIPTFSKGLSCGEVYILTQIKPNTIPADSLVKNEGLKYCFTSLSTNIVKEIIFPTIIQADKFIDKWKI